MDAILTLLALLAWLKTAFITTFAKRNSLAIWVGLICGSMALIFLPFSLEFNKKVVETHLFAPDAIANISFIVTIDFVLTVGFCKSIMCKHFNEKQNTLLKLFQHTPSFLIIPAIGYMEIAILFSFPGESFTKLSIILAVILFISIPLIGGLIRFLLPAFSQKLKAFAFICLLIVALATCCTVFHPETAIYHPADAIDWKHMLLTLFVIVGTCGAGWLSLVIKKHFK